MNNARIYSIVSQLQDNCDDIQLVTAAADLMKYINPTRDVLREFYTRLDETVRCELSGRFAEWDS